MNEELPELNNDAALLNKKILRVLHSVIELYSEDKLLLIEFENNILDLKEKCNKKDIEIEALINEIKHLENSYKLLKIKYNKIVLLARDYYKNQEHFDIDSYLAIEKYSLH